MEGEIIITEKISVPEIVLDTHSITWNNTDGTINVEAGSTILKVAFKNVNNNFSVEQTAPNFLSSNIAIQNNHLVRLDQLNSIVSGVRWSDSVDAIYNNASALPSSPANGDRYIALVTANGWIINNIYESRNGQWIEFLTEQGLTVVIYSLDTNYIFNGTNWVSH